MELSFSKRDDLMMEEIPTMAGTAIDNLTGKWLNTDRNSGQIAEIDIRRDGDDFYMRAFGAGKEAGETIDWGETKCELFSSSLQNSNVEGYTAHYDLGYQETQIAANVKYGILVIQTYNSFKDDSGRRNYFKREFFHL